MPTYEQLPHTRAPAVITSLEYGFAPRSFMERRRHSLGRAFVAHGLYGPGIFTADPEHIRRLFAADSDALSTSSAVSIVEVVGDRSVLVTSGPPHKRQRKLLAPPLHGARLREFSAAIQRIADKHVATLVPGGKLRALGLTTKFTLDVIVQTVFGASEEDEARVLRGLIHEMVRSFPPLFVIVPQLRQSWFPPWARFLSARKSFRDWTLAKIRNARRSPERSASVMSLLLDARYDDASEMDDDEICDQLVTLLLAGHETTAITLANCMARVCQHPDIAQGLRDELASTDDVVRAPYLSAFIDETLRLDVVVPDVGRIANRDFALDEQLSLRKGQLVVISIEGLHMDPELYPDPHTFRPERFLARKFAPHEFVAFGGGVRRCIGAAFSDLETKLMLASLLRAHRWQLTRGKLDRRVRRNVTMGPQHGVPIRIAKER
ncbi:MAG: cytochrome P450 [Polyangiales bacterium]